jgi:hypothetical protein
VMFDAVVFCPYCGSQQSEQQDLINFLKDQVWILSCRECSKDCVLVLYDDVRSSTPKASEDG